MLRRLICFLILLPTLIFAIELGPVEVQTPLYQPLRATIALQQLQNIPVKELQATLASQYEFKEAGLVKTHLIQQLQFAINPGKKGHAVISITSTKPIQEPYISFLLKLSWLQGDYIKKYTLLLDPPAELEATQTKTTLTVEKPQVNTVQHQRTSNPRIYGPTKHYETLWQVAKKLRPNKLVTMPQTMLAIVSLNPNAFQRHNINGLMSGYHLKVPTLKQIQSIPKAEAEQDLRQHKLFWQKKKRVKLHKLPIAIPVVVSQPVLKEPVVINPIIAETADTTPNKAREPTEAVVPKTALLDTRAIDTLPPELLVIQQNLKKALSENVFLKKSNQKLQQQVAQLQQENEHLQTQFAAKVTVASPATAKPIVTTTSSSMKTNKTAIVKPAVEPGIFTVIMDFWWQILVILALLLFLIIWGVVRKRNNNPKPEPSSSTPSDDIGPELDIDIVSEDEPTIDIHNIESAPEEINTDVIVDVNSILPEVTVKEVRRKKPKVELNAASATEILHEAKLYLDYGSNEQAKEMLETVAALESTDDAIWEELLCLYASLNDSKGLASMITKIPPGLLKDEKSNLWKKIELLRQKNDAPKSAIDIVASAIIEDGKVDASDDEAKFDDTANEADAFSFTAAEEQIELTLLDEVNAPAANDDSEDLIELPEGDETQLDLATAYLAMDDHKAAKKVLLALLKSNEPAIKQKAEALLDTLKD